MHLFIPMLRHCHNKQVEWRTERNIMVNTLLFLPLAKKQ